MKRYVMELAADRKRDLKGCILFAAQHDNQEAAEAANEEIERINTILQQCKYGYISDYEAVRQLVKE